MQVNAGGVREALLLQYIRILRLSGYIVNAVEETSHHSNK